MNLWYLVPFIMGLINIPLIKTFDINLLSTGLCFGLGIAMIINYIIIKKVEK